MGKKSDKLSRGAADVTPLGKRLRYAVKRYKEGPQKSLARRCGVTQAAVSKWALGSVKSLGCEYLYLLADMCNVNPRWLATGEGDPEEVGPDISESQRVLLRNLDAGAAAALARLPKELQQSLGKLAAGLADKRAPDGASAPAMGRRRP